MPDHATGVLVAARHRGRASRSPGRGDRTGPASGREPAWSRSGSPMSTSSTSPQRLRAGSRRWQGFSSPKVTVRVALKDCSGTAPVSASTPEGRSTAIIGTPRPSQSLGQHADVIGQPGPAADAENAVQHQVAAATTPGGSSSSPRSSSSRSRPPAACRAARPRWCGVPRQRTAVTDAPRPASRAPANRASPPLLPGPTRTRTRAAVDAAARLGQLADRDRGQPAAARCIKASAPTSSMACASSARIVATSYALIIRPRRPPRPRRSRHRGTG